MRLRVTDLPADRLVAAVSAAFFFSDQRPLQGPAALLDWRLNGQLTALLRDGRVEGRPGEHVVVANNGKLRSDWILFAGAGRIAKLDLRKWRELVGNLWGVCRAAGYDSLALALEPMEGFDRSQLIALVEELLGDSVNEPVDCLLSVREPAASRIEVVG